MDGTIGEIRPFAGDRVPRDWKACDGQLLSVNDYAALYSIIATTYGGDGQTTFGLPDLRGRVALGTGQSYATSYYTLGQTVGTETNHLTVDNLPEHTHTVSHNLEFSHGLTGTVSPTCSTAGGTEAQPGGHFLSVLANEGGDDWVPEDETTEVMGTSDIKFTGGVTIGGTLDAEATGDGAAVNNMSPFQVVSYIICVNGVYPIRP